MNIIDLHMHSSISSDGEVSPQHIVEMGHKKGLRVMSLTDHNSVRGVSSAIETARSYGITMIPGIEIDCVFQNINLHVLGYGIDIEDHAFVHIEEAANIQEWSVFTKMIIRLQEL